MAFEDILVNDGVEEEQSNRHYWQGLSTPMKKYCEWYLQLVDGRHCREKSQGILPLCPSFGPVSELRGVVRSRLLEAGDRLE